ncbi:DinB family protein [Virgibacillus doumboii]|uniref:DinB family protein n=1 Tax=Virgibacillus doumboii TaxID=2697503 RepID=UPI0013DF1855|nr:DinB family protein [Virgibacillus doumboii]
MQSNELKLFEYHIWANNKVFDRLLELPDGIYNQKVESVFESLSAVVSHMYTTDILWLGLISGDSNEEVWEAAGQAWKEVKGKSAEQTKELYNTLGEQYKEMISKRDKSLHLKHPKFGELDTTMLELVQHVVNHGTYHRGNITAMLRQMGYAGVSTDYIFYLYDLK